MSNKGTDAAVEPEDPVELMLKKTGCIDLHHKVQVRDYRSVVTRKLKILFWSFLLQECIFDTQDWRKCQDIVKEFKSCMTTYNEEQRKKYAK